MSMGLPTPADDPAPSSQPRARTAPARGARPGTARSGFAHPSPRCHSDASPGQSEDARRSRRRPLVRHPSDEVTMMTHPLHGGRVVVPRLSPRLLFSSPGSSSHPFRRVAIPNNNRIMMISCFCMSRGGRGWGGHGSRKRTFRQGLAGGGNSWLPGRNGDDAYRSSRTASARKACTGRRAALRWRSGGVPPGRWAGKPAAVAVAVDGLQTTPESQTLQECGVDLRHGIATGDP